MFDLTSGQFFSSDHRGSLKGDRPAAYPVKQQQIKEKDLYM